MGLLRALGVSTERPLRGVELDLHKHFRIIKELGRGSYSQVFKVQRISDGAFYALKITETDTLSHTDQRAMLEEIRLLASLHHPNLVRYYEAFVDHCRLCVVMQLVKGGDLTSTLQKRFSNGDFLSEREVWNYLLQAALGLQHLHKNHVLHRDMKPQNLLLGADGILRISDLGVSQEVQRVFTRLNVGTPQYMSPEMHRRQPYSYSADIWALGCIAHELCMLQPLFFTEKTKTEADVAALVLSGHVPVLPGRYSAPLRHLVSQLLLKDPSSRPTIDEVLATPSVQAHMDCLPSTLHAQLAAAAGRLHGGTERLAQQIPLPSTNGSGGRFCLDQLNAFLPPAQYAVGGGVADAQRERRRLEAAERLNSSASNLQMLSSHGSIVAAEAESRSGGTGSTDGPGTPPPTPGQGLAHILSENPSVESSAPSSEAPGQSRGGKGAPGTSRSLVVSADPLDADYSAVLQRRSVMVGEVLHLAARQRTDAAAAMLAAAHSRDYSSPGACATILEGAGSGAIKESSSYGSVHSSCDIPFVSTTSSGSFVGSDSRELPLALPLAPDPSSGSTSGSALLAERALLASLRRRSHQIERLEGRRTFQPWRELPTVQQFERVPFQFRGDSGYGPELALPVGSQPLPSTHGLSPASVPAAAGPQPAAVSTVAVKGYSSSSLKLSTAAPAAAPLPSKAASNGDKKTKRKGGWLRKVFSSEESGAGMHQPLV